MTFQSIVLTVALVTLILVLALVAYLIHTSKSDMKFPPETPSCPDYFEAVSDEKGNPTEKCNNVQGLGNGVPGVTDFALINSGELSCPGNNPCADSALKARCSWAKQHNITWDGVTNKTVSIKNPAGEGHIIKPLCTN